MGFGGVKRVQIGLKMILLINDGKKVRAYGVIRKIMGIGKDFLKIRPILKYMDEFFF